MKIKAGLKFHLEADVDDYKEMLRDGWAGSMDGVVEQIEGDTIFVRLVDGQAWRFSSKTFGEVTPLMTGKARSYGIDRSHPFKYSDRSSNRLNERGNRPPGCKAPKANIHQAIHAHRHRSCRLDGKGGARGGRTLPERGGGCH